MGLKEYQDKTKGPFDGKLKMTTKAEEMAYDKGLGDGYERGLADGKPETVPGPFISNCGVSTVIYHTDDAKVIVFCVLRNRHKGSHDANVTWDNDAS